MRQSNIRRLAAGGLRPPERDEAGTYWYRPKHLEVVARAQAAVAAQERGEPPAPAELVDAGMDPPAIGKPGASSESRQRPLS